MRIHLLIMLVLLSTVSVCGPTDIAINPANQHVISAAGIFLEVNFGNGTVLNYSNLTGIDVLNITEIVLDTTVEWYGDLAYVTAIDDVASDSSQGLWWQYWVNGELAYLAANKYILQENDDVVWIRQASAIGGNEPPKFDDSLIIGTTSLSIVSVGFLVFLFLRKHRRLK